MYPYPDLLEWQRYCDAQDHADLVWQEDGYVSARLLKAQEYTDAMFEEYMAAAFNDLEYEPSIG